MQDKEKDPDHPVRTAVLVLLQPCNVLDFIENFVVFETSWGKTTKKIAPYQQFEAANDMVDRAVELYGSDVGTQNRTGSIWHMQGRARA